MRTSAQVRETSRPSCQASANGATPEVGRGYALALTQFAEVTGQRERLDEFVTDANIKCYRRIMIGLLDEKHGEMIARLLNEKQASLRIGSATMPALGPAIAGRDRAVKSVVATFHAIGEPIWYRQVAQIDIQVAGVVEDIIVGTPSVTYCVRLENKDRVWADFSQLVPRYG